MVSYAFIASFLALLLYCVEKCTKSKCEGVMTNTYGLFLLIGELNKSDNFTVLHEVNTVC